MAVSKLESGSVLERAVQWAKDISVKIMAAVAEYGASAYAKADKPAAKSPDASASIDRAAAKFLDKPDMKIKYLSLEELKTGNEQRVGTSEHIYRALSDDRIIPLLEEAMKDPTFKAHMKSDIQKILDRRNQTR